MHAINGVTRILILLLLFRVLAAPIAARPESHRPYAKAGFIVRVCAWPARASMYSAVGSPEYDDRLPGGDAAEFLPASARAIAFLTRARVFHWVVLRYHDPSSCRIRDSLRC